MREIDTMLFVLLCIVNILIFVLIVICKKILNCMVDFLCEFLESKSKENEQDFLKHQMILSMYGDVLKAIKEEGEKYEKGKEGSGTTEGTGEQVN